MKVKNMKNKIFIIAILIAIITISSICFIFIPKNNPELIISPDDPEEKFISLINSANDSIYIENYYFTNEKIALSLIAAKNRGVKVYTLIENNEGVDKIYKLLNENNISIKIDKRETLIHSKFIVIDKKIVIIGSHNLTKTAMEKNREVSIIVKNEEIAKELIEVFERDYYLT
jgi:phosphatidylserine/phosphatidylglycerophosphate/cardiolipin synthase-like enzyme